MSILDESPAVRDVAGSYDQAPNTDFEQYARQMGAPVDDLKQQIKKEDIHKTVMDAAFEPLGNDGKPVSSGSDILGAAKGVGKGLVDLANNVTNTGIDLANGISNFAAQYGVGRGDIAGGHVNWSEKMNNPEDSMAAKTMRAITRYGAPVVATAPFVGPLAGLAAGAAVDFLTVDPNQQRLADVLKEEVPSLKNYPAAYAVVDAMSTKQNEGPVERRFKTALEGFAVGAPIAGAFYGMSRFASKAQKAERAIQEVSNGATSIERQSVPSTEAMQGDLFNYAATKTTPAGEVRFNPNNTDVVAYAAQFAKAHPQTAEEMRRGPKAFAELDAQAQGVLTNPKEMDKLLSWKLGDRPLTDSEVVASKYMLNNLHQEVATSAQNFVSSKSDETLVHFSNMLDTFEHVHGVREGAGSEGARALNAHKIIADMRGKTVEESNKLLTDEGRQELLKNILKYTGNREDIEDMAHQIVALHQMNPEDVQEALAKAAKVSKGKSSRLYDIVKSVAINGMLSSPKTTVANHFSNFMTANKQIFDNYINTGIGFARGTEDGMTLAQSNAYLRGHMASIIEGFSAMGQALKKGSGGPANIVKGDLVGMINPISAGALGVPVERNMGYKILGSIVDKVGLATGFPSRMNATADAFWGTRVYRSNIYQQAQAGVEQLGLEGVKANEFVQNFIKNPPIEAHDGAVAAAKELTFSKALEFDSLAGQVDRTIGKIPAGRILLPFFKTNANIIEYTFKNSPMAIFSPNMARQVLEGGKVGDMALAKMTSGGLFLGGATYLASQGLISGSDPKNAGQRQALEESGQGWQPDSFKAGDTWVSIKKLDYMSSVFRLGSVISSLHNFISEDEYTQLAHVSMSAVADYFTPEMLTEGWSRYLEAFNDIVHGKDSNAPGNVAADVAGRLVPFSALQRDIKNAIDPLKAEAGGSKLDTFIDKIINRYKAQSPFFSQDMPVQRNMFAEPLMVPDGLGPDFISPFATSKAGNSALTMALNSLAGFHDQQKPIDPTVADLPISMPPKTFKFKDVSVDLTPSEYERFVLYTAGKDANGKNISGSNLRQDLESVVLDNVQPLLDQKMSTKEYNKIVGKVSGFILKHRQIGEAMMLQDPEVMARWKKAADASLQLKEF